MNTILRHERLRAFCATILGYLALLGLLSGTQRTATAYDNLDCGDCIVVSDDCCSSGCCNAGGCGCDGGVSWWLGGDYLLWQTNGMDLPPLVTTSSSTTNLANAGQFDDPATRIVSGNTDVADTWRNGYRLYGGFYLDSCHCLAIVGDYFQTGDDEYNYIGTPNSSIIMTRPFYNTETDEADAELVSVPNQLDGTIRVAAYDEFKGAGISLQKCLWSCGNPCGPCPSSFVQATGGYRYYQYDTGLTISEDLTVLPGTTTPLVPGTQIDVLDQFTTRNEFHGGEIGLKTQHKQSWWWIDGEANLAVGGHRRTVNVAGQTTNTVPGAGQATFEGGLLTSEVTNIGSYSDTRTVVIPRFRLGVGGQLTQLVSMRCGYNVIFWNGLAQGASHLPTGLEVDPRNIPPVVAGGGPEPAFPGIHGSDLVVHGFDFGVQLSY